MTHDWQEKGDPIVDGSNLVLIVVPVALGLGLVCDVATGLIQIVDPPTGE